MDESKRCPMAIRDCRGGEGDMEEDEYEMKGEVGSTRRVLIKWLR